MPHVSGSHLLEKLLHFEEGVKKYGSDPKFPDLTRIGDVGAMHDLLARALIQAVVSRAKAKEDDGAARAMATQAIVLYQKLVLAVQLYAGKRSDVLRAFGLTPYRVGGRKKRKAAAAAHGAAGHGARTHGASGGAGDAAGGSSTGAPASSGESGSGGSSGSAPAGH